MARLVWNSVGARYYETGVDRGVLFLGANPGVAWPGLVSVAEAPTGGEAKPYYIDGFKYLNIASAEEFEATIEALSSPIEFSSCDGIGEVQNGLFATQQPRRPFSMCYRSLVGNDLDGHKHGYKIHIVYNALAAPTSRNHKTLGDSGEVDTYSWGITTKPPKLTGRRPTAHFVVDSRYTPASLLLEVNDILYGTDTEMSRLPDADELVDLFTNWV